MSEKYPDKISDLSDEEMFVILRPKSINIPGDERSRTNPGHGYPASTEHYLNMEVYSKDEWIAEIEKLTTNNDSFKAVRMIPAKISTIVTVE